MSAGQRQLTLWGEIVANACHATPELTADEWADSHRVLPRVSSSEPGRWRTSRTPYLREILQELSASNDREEVVFAKGSQIAGTEALINWILYLMDVAPGPALLVQPTVDMGKRFSRQRLTPSIDACRQLDGVMLANVSRDAANSILQKDFVGGTLMIGGANSAAGLRSMPIKALGLDEIDSYPEDVDGEGDPVELAVRRTATFARKKIFYNSSPTLLQTSRIWALYEDSDQRRYEVPCPHCGGMQTIEWEQMKWEPGKPETAELVCIHCDRGILEEHKPFMLDNGVWVARKPGHLRAGFHISALYSPLGWYSWPKAVAAFEAAITSVRKRQVFRNTVLGLPWDEEGVEADPNALAKRTEEYSTLPDAAQLITCGVDVQPKRLEAQVFGWGFGKESWVIDYQVFYGRTDILKGQPGQPAAWEQLDEYLRTPFKYADGREMYLACTCVDSGGHNTQEVYRFCRQREGRRIFAIKGRGGQGVPAVSKPTRANRVRAALFIIGVNTLKDTLFDRLEIKKTEADESSPGYIHFREDVCDGKYFKGLTSEKRVIRTKNGVPRIYWVKVSEHARNEPLDTAVYAMAAVEIINPKFLEIAPGPVKPAVSQEKQAVKKSGRPVGAMSRGVKI